MKLKLLRMLAVLALLFAPSLADAAWIQEDRVRETSTTTGTGNLALAGALTGYKDFDTVCANGDTFNYLIVNRDVPGEWETGKGTFNDTDTLVRTTVRNSSNADAAVSFSAGTKDVSIVAWPQGDTFQLSAASSNPTDATTRYFGSFQNVPTSTDGLYSFPIPFAGTITRADLGVICTVAATGNESTTASVRVNTTDTTISAAVKHTPAATRLSYSVNVDIAVAAGDTVQFKLVYPTHTVDPTGCFYNGSVLVQ